ncbi:response regulator [Candidatus Woesebacteria bacterium]|nr:response regulator [Candidatus Woesebacteria bacterium]
MGKILLVEDDPTLSKLYETLLSSEGFEIVKAREIQSALDLLSQEEISLALLDVMLVEHNSGIDLLQKMKSNENTKDIPVIILTNVAKDEERNRALELGAKEYLVKAAQKPSEVVGIVKKYI